MQWGRASCEPALSPTLMETWASCPSAPHAAAAHSLSDSPACAVYDHPECRAYFIPIKTELERRLLFYLPCVFQILLFGNSVSGVADTFTCMYICQRVYICIQCEGLFIVSMLLEMCHFTALRESPPAAARGQQASSLPPRARPLLARSLGVCQ